jgi:hypothetical protein
MHSGNVAKNKTESETHSTAICQLLMGIPQELRGELPRSISFSRMIGSARLTSMIVM